VERDEFDRLRAVDSLQYKLGVLGFPVVNYYSLFLKDKVERYFGIVLESKKYGGSNAAIALTHDVDFSSFLNFRMIRREIFGIAVLNRHGLRTNERATKLLFPLYALLATTCRRSASASSETASWAAASNRLSSLKAGQPRNRTSLTISDPAL